jgi:hypothetical protein
MVLPVHLQNDLLDINTFKGEMTNGLSITTDAERIDYDFQLILEQKCITRTTEREEIS